MEETDILNVFSNFILRTEFEQKSARDGSTDVEYFNSPTKKIVECV